MLFYFDNINAASKGNSLGDSVIKSSSDLQRRIVIPESDERRLLERGSSVS